MGHGSRKRYKPDMARAHDYLYDSAYIVSGARDYARTVFRAAMQSAQMSVQPVYGSMFSCLRHVPRMHVVYHTNCRLPPHMDRSYGSYCARVANNQAQAMPALSTRNRFQFWATPKKVTVRMASTSPEFNPPAESPMPDLEPTKPRHRGTQSDYRESYAQTVPWQPDGVAAETCETKPEVLYLDQFEWGPGRPYRIGDLPADFHTTEIINKMRHHRVWSEIAERGKFPQWMKKREQIITDLETKDWIFREAEIDELQDIRLELLHRIQEKERGKQSTKMSRKLAGRWASKKEEMERRIAQIRRARDRELRKLSALHYGGGSVGLVQRKREARGGGDVAATVRDPASTMYAPVLRNGYQASGRHAEISYDPDLIALEDHIELSELPPWLATCGTDLKHTCSGGHLPRDTTTLCERETKWSEKFLENLHDDLKKARLGAAETSAGPLHVLRPRRLVDTPRPATPTVDSVPDRSELKHQAALLLQKIIRGRAVQCLMYEGRTRAAELTEELKTTHGLQKEDKVRIAREETRAREYNAMRSEAEQKEDAISALVDELCGGAVSAALDFLEKELRRLKEERRQHAFILIALREKAMREAAEAGRRQKEEHRRREHDEMFKQVVGATQETVDAYLRHVVADGVELGAAAEAERRAKIHADNIDEQRGKEISINEENEQVAELVQMLLLPHAQREAAHQRLKLQQQGRLKAARDTIFKLLDEGEIREHAEGTGYCARCGVPLGEKCKCPNCDAVPVPIATKYRDDLRWKLARRQPVQPRTLAQRYPPALDIRGMLDSVVDNAVERARRLQDTVCAVFNDCLEDLTSSVEVTIEAKELVRMVVDIACGATTLPLMERKARYYMRSVVGDAQARTEPYPKIPCPHELPSSVRAREAALEPADSTCHCKDQPPGTSHVQFGEVPLVEELDDATRRTMLPSAIRALEEMRRCKCDSALELVKAKKREHHHRSESVHIEEPVEKPQSMMDSLYSELMEMAEGDWDDDED